jgi:hypothetical protein
MIDMLERRWANAEQRFLSAGLTDDAVHACLECHKWPDAMRIAEENHHPNVDNLKQSYMEHLLETGQLEEAGQVKEQQGDIQVLEHSCCLKHSNCCTPRFLRIYRRLDLTTHSNSTTHVPNILSV